MFLAVRAWSPPHGGFHRLLNCDVRPILMARGISRNSAARSRCAGPDLLGGYGLLDCRRTA